MVNKTIRLVFVLQLPLLATVAYLAVTADGLELVYVVLPIAIAALLFLVNLACLLLLAVRAAKGGHVDGSTVALGLATFALPLAYWVLDYATV